MTEQGRVNGLGSDLNGNSSTPQQNVAVKDYVTTSGGQVLFPCQFCNKVFPIKKARAIHIETCPAKDYILSVESKKTELKKPPAKIDIQQNIILSKQLNVNEILSRSKSPIKSVSIDQTNFTVSNTLILKEKNEANEDFDHIAQRLESNSVTIIKKTKEDNKTENPADSETTCRECLKEFQSPLELLRHGRKCHSYPKVLMALSEVKKFYSVKDRSSCPICRKPLKVNFRSAFVKHLHTHTNEMKYSCTVCNKKFRRSDHMKAHEKRHVIEKK